MKEYFQTIIARLINFHSLFAKIHLNKNETSPFITELYRFDLQFMFRSFLRFFGPRQLGLFAAFSLIKLSPYFPTSEENERINKKLKRILNQKYHNRKDISFELTEEYRKDMVIFTGNSNDALAKEIAQILKIELGNIKVGRFNDGQVSIEVKDNVRSKNVYIIQSTSPPVNESLMELLLMVSTMRRASAKKIIVVMPYYGYARQDRKTAPRVPISAADVARLLETVGVDRVILVDVHSGQIQGFFGPRVPVDNLQANLVALNYFVQQKKIPLRDIVVVSPDAGGVTRAKNFQALLSSVGVKETSLAMIIKQRKAAGEIGTMHLVGNVEGKQAIIIDDIIDTAGTLVEATKVLKDKGALSVSCFATHGLLTGKALENIKKSLLDQVIVTNSIPAKQNEEAITDGKIRRLSVAPILAQAIFRIETKTSISSLFSIPKT